MRRVADVHILNGDPGILLALFFSRGKICRTVMRAEVSEAVRQCEVCRTINPAPVKWQHTSLSVVKTWCRLATDITQYLGCGYVVSRRLQTVSVLRVATAAPARR